MVYGIEASPDRGHKDGGWGEDKRDDDGCAEDGGLVEVAPEPLRILISNVQGSGTEKKHIFRHKTHMFSAGEPLNRTDVAVAQANIINI